MINIKPPRYGISLPQPLSDRTCRILLSVCCLYVACCLSMSYAQQPDNQEDLQWAMDQLPALDLIFRTDTVMSIIFDAKEKAFPYLVANFLNRRRYYSWCGSDGLISEAKVVKVDKSKIISPAEAKKYDDPRNSRVRDVCLYMILAIMKNKLYFANTCFVHYESEDSYQQALSEISFLYCSSLQSSREFSLQGVEEIMSKHRVYFH